MTEMSPSNPRGWVHKALTAGARLSDWVILTLEGWRERSRLRWEFDKLERQGELGRTLIDSGIAPSDVPRLMRAHPHTLEQLDTMMRRLGIDRTSLQRKPAIAEALRAMEWRCGECADWRKCRAWLAAPDAPASYRSFCPNAEALDALRCSATAGKGPEARTPCRLLSELESAQGRGGAQA